MSQIRQFRDPVHGYIQISQSEKKLIDSRPFQRLRHIRQLATTYLVYHGAEHTRFGHSLGVMHLVTQVFDSVTDSNPNLFSDDNKENTARIVWYRQILRLIALTHDLGHAPFSHASSELFPDGREHECYTKLIIEEREISEIISEISTTCENTITKTLGTSVGALRKNYRIRPITPQLLWMIYGEEPRIPLNDDDEYQWPDFAFLKSFMDGELDCDKMDYLLRDSLYCGVTYGKYDLDRFISTLTAYKDENILQLAIRSGGVQAFEEFVLARYFMFIQVYFHKTRRYFDNLFVRCLKEILPDGKFPAKASDYLEWDDTRVLTEIRNSSHALCKQYQNREHMTCIRETSAHAGAPDIRLLKRIYKDLQREIGDEFIVFDEMDRKSHKLFPYDLLAGDDSSVDIKVIDSHTGETQSVMERSLSLQGITKKIHICRLYTDESHIEAAKAIANR
jgi:HD superfamily phosphohydrolase